MAEYLNENRELQVARITQMEQYFDTVKVLKEKDCPLSCEKIEIDEMIRALRQYQESGQWLKDFESDERGEIPAELKRGVLSEDGLYNLLSEFDI